MRTFLHLFMGLLVPLSGLFMAAATLYFSFFMGYSFTKAMRLGVLSGFFIALAVSFGIAIFLFIMRAGRKAPVSTKKKTRKRISETVNKTETIFNKKADTQKDTSSKPIVVTSPRTQHGTSSKRMLLMDKEVAVEIVLFYIKEQNMGDITNNMQTEDSIILSTKEDVLTIRIASLTKHTSQVMVSAKPDSKDAQNILMYLKEKESSFLRY